MLQRAFVGNVPRLVRTCLNFVNFRTLKEIYIPYYERAVTSRIFLAARGACFHSPFVQV